MPAAGTSEPLIFNSFHFLVFFIVVYALYRALKHEGQNWLLLAASYYFYGSWDWRFLGLLIASTGIDYLCALYIDRRADPRRRRAALIVSLGFNLTVLGFFKYFNFFADSLQTLLHAAGLQADYATLHIVLPIGISFYTFITMSYVIDVYRRDIEPCHNLRDFALFVAYFPHLVAGPILRAGWLLPQIVKPRRVRPDQIRDGLWLIVWGFFKKVFVADNLAHVADAVFATNGHASGLEVLLGVYAFAFQIYGDFSGYSDIARGTSLLMGIELNVNFRFPYFVRSAPEFWRHWHISLSTWFRDHVYTRFLLVAVRGKWFKKRETASAAGYFVSFGLMGVWHGLEWHYIIYGLYHATLLTGYDAFTRWKKRHPHRFTSKTWAIVARLITFHFVCFGLWIFSGHGIIKPLPAEQGRVAAMSSILRRIDDEDILQHFGCFGIVSHHEAHQRSAGFPPHDVHGAQIKAGVF